MTPQSGLPFVNREMNHIRNGCIDSNTVSHFSDLGMEDLEEMGEVGAGVVCNETMLYGS